MAERFRLPMIAFAAPKETAALLYRWIESIAMQYCLLTAIKFPLLMIAFAVPKKKAVLQCHWIESIAMHYRLLITISMIFSAATGPMYLGKKINSFNPMGAATEVFFHCPTFLFLNYLRYQMSLYCFSNLCFFSNANAFAACFPKMKYPDYNIKITVETSICQTLYILYWILRISGIIYLQNTFSMKLDGNFSLCQVRHERYRNVTVINTQISDLPNTVHLLLGFVYHWNHLFAKHTFDEMGATETKIIPFSGVTRTLSKCHSNLRSYLRFAEHCTFTTVFCVPLKSSICKTHFVWNQCNGNDFPLYGHVIIFSKLY